MDRHDETCSLVAGSQLCKELLPARHLLLTKCISDASQTASNASANRESGGVRQHVKQLSLPLHTALLCFARNESSSRWLRYTWQCAEFGGLQACTLEAAKHCTDCDAASEIASDIAPYLEQQVDGARHRGVLWVRN